MTFLDFLGYKFLREKSKIFEQFESLCLRLQMEMNAISVWNVLEQITRENLKMKILLIFVTPKLS